MFVTGLRAQDNPPIEKALCYIPGAGGGSPLILHQMASLMAQKNILFIPLDNGNWGSIEERTEKTVRTLEQYLAQRPNLKCHMLAYSMGGIMLRMAMLRYRVQHPTRGLVPFSDFVLSQTSMSSPHHGTEGAFLLEDLLNNNWDPGMLALAETNVEGTYNNPVHPNYAPLVKVGNKPFYIYRTVLSDHTRASRDVEKIGVDLIAELRTAAQRDPRSDGVIPFLSQSWTQLERFTPGADRVLGDFNVGHWYFSDGGGLPDAPLQDFFEVQYNFLNRTLGLLFETQNIQIRRGVRVPRLVPIRENLRSGTLGELLKRLQKETSELPD